MSRISQNILVQYLIWYFVDVPANILRGWRNFLLFNLNYWSIPILVQTLFSYWHRYSYSYGKRFDPKRYFEAFVFNTMSRFIGAILRITFIFIGLLVEIFILILGGIILLIWIVLPAFLVFGFLFGLKILTLS